MNALNGAAFALAFLLDLQQSPSQYWRRRGRITRINRLKKAYALASIPTHDLTSPGLPEIDSGASWEAMKERAATLLARAYLGDFLDVEGDQSTSPSNAERVAKVALIGAVLAAIPALWAALQQLGAAIIWLRENRP
jgi:hypothetical protein